MTSNTARCLETTLVSGVMAINKEITMNEQEMQMKLVSQQEQVEALRQEVAEMNKEREHHQQVRIQFVGQIASAIVSNYEFYAQGIAEECKKSGKSTPEIVAQMSIEVADALIEELMKGGEQ